MKSLIITAILCAMTSLSEVHATRFSSLSPDSVKGDTIERVLHFRFDRSLVDSGYRQNSLTLDVFHRLFSDSLCVTRIDSVLIHAYTSPEGHPVYNRRLALKRARAVKGYLVWKYPRLNQYRIRTCAGVENWDALRAAVEADAKMPCRKEALSILASDVSNGRKELLLKELGAGAAYRYISRHLLPDLRNASVCTVYVRAMKHPDTWQAAGDIVPLAYHASGPALIEASRKDAAQATGDSTVHASQYITAQVFRDYIPADSAFLASIPRMPETTETRIMREKVQRRTLLALKTNLLFDAALMPNVEIEVPIGERWSLNGEYTFPWWLMNGDKYCLEILMGGLEGRYWLGNRRKHEVLTGHFLSLYAGGGKYDLQWDRNGYQGEFFIAAGIGYGWATRIARNLHLEFNLGVGLLRTNYRHYHARDEYQTLLWQENGQYTWLGPTKAKISLVWLLKGKRK